DRLGAAACPQAEQCAAVIDQVELDIAAAAELLKGSLLQCEGFVLAALGDRQVRLQEVVAAVADEGKEGVDIALEVVEEDAADAARLAAVRQVEIIVTPLLEASMVSDAGMAVADIAPDAVEVDDVFAIGIVRCQ